MGVPLGRKQVASSLIAVGVLLLALTVWGHVNPDGRLLVHEFLDRPYILAVLGYAAIAFGVAGLQPERTMRVVVAILLGAVGATGFALAGLVTSAGVSPYTTIEVAPAPGGDYEAVVESDNNPSGATARVWVRHTSFDWSSRYWLVACDSARTPKGDLLRVEWAGPTELDLVRADGSRAEVVIDQRSLEPVRALSTGPRCGAL